MGSIIGNIVIAGFFLLFALANLKGFQTTGDIGYILIALNESVYVVLYLVRQRATTVSASASDWAVAFSATFLGTLLRPASPFNALLGTSLIIVGTAANFASALSLNRSLGIVPARRMIKTEGIYRFVRHPMYASGIVILIGYLLANVSAANAFIVVSVTVLLLVRIDREERFLSTSEPYRTYIAKTPWKLVPFVY